MSKLKNKIKSLPKRPGIYIFKNKVGEIIYIGKALSLKNRVADYFRQKHPDAKTKQLVSQIDNFEYHVLASEFDALMLEAKLIKEHKPKYNIRLKDNKRYLYIGITKKPFRIFPLRRPELEENLYDWFGPFPSSGEVRQVLRILRRLYPYCSCKNPPRRQCLYSHIKLCPGYQKLDTVKYQQEINKIRRILNGKSSRLIISDLKKQMSVSAKKLEFEKAQRVKEQLSAFVNITQFWRKIPNDDLVCGKALISLKRLFIKYQNIDPMIISKIEGFDISNLGKNIIVGAMVCFVDGQPEKTLYRKFKISSPGWIAKQNDPGSIKQIISRRLNHPEWLYPQVILVDGGKGQISSAFEAIKEKQLDTQICLLGLTKKKETIVIPIMEKRNIVGWEMLNYSENNPTLQLLQQIRDESHRFAHKYYKKLYLKKPFNEIMNN